MKERTTAILCLAKDARNFCALINTSGKSFFRPVCRAQTNEKGRQIIIDLSAIIFGYSRVFVKCLILCEMLNPIIRSVADVAGNSECCEAGS